MRLLLGGVLRARLRGAPASREASIRPSRAQVEALAKRLAQVQATVELMDERLQRDASAAKARSLHSSERPGIAASNGCGLWQT